MGITVLASKIIATLGATAILLTALQAMMVQDLSLGSAPAGLPASFVSASSTDVSTTVGTIFATSSNCAARVISTDGSAIMLTFSQKDGEEPSGSVGHWQAASSTVVYDGGIYGCDAVRAYSYATQDVQVYETR